MTLMFAWLMLAPAFADANSDVDSDWDSDSDSETGADTDGDSDEEDAGGGCGGCTTRETRSDLVRAGVFLSIAAAGAGMLRRRAADDT